MSWTDKVHKKNQLNKAIEQALRSPEFQEIKRQENEQAVLKAIVTFCFIGCEYLELKHGYGNRGLNNFLEFMKGRINEVGDDDTYREDVTSYYMENHNLDVMEKLGLIFIEKDSDL
jgi:hypothetical protein